MQKHDSSFVNGMASTLVGGRVRNSISQHRVAMLRRCICRACFSGILTSNRRRMRLKTGPCQNVGFPAAGFACVLHAKSIVFGTRGLLKEYQPTVPFHVRNPELALALALLREGSHSECIAESDHDFHLRLLDLPV